jgi:hypothetical protein
MSAVKEGQQKYCETVYSRSGTRQCHKWDCLFHVFLFSSFKASDRVSSANIERKNLSITKNENNIVIMFHWCFCTCDIRKIYLHHHTVHLTLQSINKQARECQV